MAHVRRIKILTEFPGLYHIGSYWDVGNQPVPRDATPKFLRLTCREIADTPVDIVGKPTILETKVFLYVGDCSCGKLYAENVLDIYDWKWDLPLAEVVRTTWSDSIIYAFFVVRYRTNRHPSVEIYRMPSGGDMQPLVKEVLRELDKKR